VNPEFALAIVCDLSKTFDVINHDIILYKLNSYGIRGMTKQWFHRHLSDTYESVELGKDHLSHLPI